MNRYQVKQVKDSIDLIEKMKFARKSAKVQYIISTISNSINSMIKLPEKYNKDIKREVEMIQAIEDKELMKSCILGNKMIFGGETKYNHFINILNKKIAIEPDIDS